MAQLLGLWNTRLLTALGGGGFEGFLRAAARAPRGRAALWRDSRVARRGCSTSCAKAALLMYYMKPGPDGRSSPMWEHTGFPGPPGRREDAAGPRSRPSSPIAT